jgi:opacity protein-like surface antigen
MKLINAAGIIGSIILVTGLFPPAGAGALKYGELRVGAHASYINPKDSDFDAEFGYGGIVKYKFTDMLGIEAGVDYFRWSVEEDIVMPFEPAPGPVYYKEVDRVYPIYFTALIYSPVVEEMGRGYLGLGAGYYEIDANIDGYYDVEVDGTTYPFTITGNVTGQWSVHAAVGADFQLSDHIFLNVEARYVLTDIDREQTHSNPDRGAVTIKEEAEFKNWQIRAGLEYSF